MLGDGYIGVSTFDSSCSFSFLISFICGFGRILKTDLLSFYSIIVGSLDDASSLSKPASLAVKTVGFLFKAVIASVFTAILDNL